MEYPKDNFEYYKDKITKDVGFIIKEQESIISDINKRLASNSFYAKNGFSSQDTKNIEASLEKHEELLETAKALKDEITDYIFDSKSVSNDNYMLGVINIIDAIKQNDPSINDKALKDSIKTLMRKKGDEIVSEFKKEEQTIEKNITILKDKEIGSDFANLKQCAHEKMRGSNSKNIKIPSKKTF